MVGSSLADTALSDTFTAPAAPKTFYNAPSPSYSAPSYSAPSSSYGAPSSSYGAPGVQTVQVRLISLESGCLKRLELKYNFKLSGFYRSTLKTISFWQTWVGRSKNHFLRIKGFCFLKCFLNY